MKEYNGIKIDGDKVYLENGKIRKDRIGVNYLGIAYVSRQLSSFDKPFTDEAIAIGSGMEMIETKIGDISDAYLLLEQKIKENNPQDFVSLCAVVLETVDDYFKGFSKHNERMNYYYDNDYEEAKNNKISNLKGKSAAMCTERAALSQNLLYKLGINSIYKCSTISVNDRNECHSYNLVNYNNKYYIFDSSMPNMINNKPNPLICEISKEDFDLISCPLHDTGCSITVSHFNPYQNIDYTVKYDNYRKKQIEVLPIQNETLKK